jgi:type II secretory pathway component PulF
VGKYRYRARDVNDHWVEGELVASDFDDALQQLRQQDLCPEKMVLLPEAGQPADEGLSDSAPQSLLSSPEALRTQALLNARSWSDPLDALAGEKRFKKSAGYLRRVASSLRSAETVDALAVNPETAEFLPVLIRSWQADEDSMSWLANLDHRFGGAGAGRYGLLYSILCLLAAVCLLVFFAVQIVPVFGQMFSEFGLNLPAPTRLLVWLSSQLQEHPLRALLIVLGGGLTIWAVRMLCRYSKWMHRYFPWLMAGSRQSVRAMGVVAQNTAELIGLGYERSSAVRFAAEGCRHSFIRSNVLNLAQEMSAGKRPDQTVSSRWLPPLFCKLLGSIANADTSKLQQLGMLYRERWQSALPARRPVLLSQMILLSAGVLLGFGVLALLMPLVSLVTGLSN